VVEGLLCHWGHVEDEIRRDWADVGWVRRRGGGRPSSWDLDGRRGFEVGMAEGETNALWAVHCGGWWKREGERVVNTAVTAQKAFGGWFDRNNAIN
jgi:hypothetical protein